MASDDVIAVASADWHGAPGAWVARPQIAGDAYYGIHQLVDLCLRLSKPLLAAGDLHEEWPDAKTLAVIFEELTRLQTAGIPFLFIRGNHEGKGEEAYLALHPWATHLRPGETHRLKPYSRSPAITGFDHCHADTLPAALAEVNKYEHDILLCHQAWAELQGPGKAEGKLSDTKARLVITGDLHQAKEVRLADGRLALSPGPVCLQGIDESPAKCCWLIHADLSVTPVPLKTRKAWDSSISATDSLERLLPLIEEMVIPQSGVPDSLAKNIIYITCSETVPEAYNRVEAAIEGRAHLFWKTVPVSVIPATYDGERRDAIMAGSTSGGLVDCLELAVPKENEDYGSLLRLLTSEPVKELATMEKEFTDENLPRS